MNIRGRVNYKEVLKGDIGFTYTPHVTQEGVLYWTNNGDLTNPQPVNIKGIDGNIIQNELISSIIDLNLDKIIDNETIKLSNIPYYFKGDLNLNCSSLNGISSTSINGYGNIIFNSENVIIKNITFNNINMIYKYNGSITFENCSFNNVGKSCLYIENAIVEFKNCKCMKIGVNLNDDYTYLGGLVYGKNCEKISVSNTNCEEIFGQACIRFDNLIELNVDNVNINKTKYRGIGGVINNTITNGYIKNSSFNNIGVLNNVNGVGCNAIYTYNGSTNLNIINNSFTNIVENAIEGNYNLIENNTFQNIGFNDLETPSKECIWGDINHIIGNFFENIKLYPINKSVDDFSIKTIANNIFVKGDLSEVDDCIRCLNFNEKTIIDNNININYKYLLNIENKKINSSKIFINNRYNYSLNPKGHYWNLYVDKNNIISKEKTYDDFINKNMFNLNNSEKVSYENGLLTLRHNNEYDSFLYKEFDVDNENIIMVNVNMKGVNICGVRIVPYVNGKWDYEKSVEYYKESNNEIIDIHFTCLINKLSRVEFIDKGKINDNYEIKNIEITLKENGGF